MPNSKQLSSQEQRILAHQIELPEIGLDNQITIKNAKVLVIGAGGKGTATMQQLAKSGVGTIGICDNYPIEESELPRQSIYGCKDLGKLRAIAVKEKLAPVNQFVEFVLHNICLSEDNIHSIIEPYDILIDATDNFPSRFMINDAAIKLKKPLVYASLLNSVGMLSVFNYHDGPSLRCLYPQVPKGNEKPVLDNMFSWGVPLSILGSLACAEVLKLILNKETRLSGELMQFNFSDYTIHYQKIEKNKENFSLA
jgi:molybdopterin/thiamine biosynthesis adenylyltransferase